MDNDTATRVEVWAEATNRLALTLAGSESRNGEIDIEGGSRGRQQNPAADMGDVW